MLEAEAQDIENKAQRDDGERTHVTDRLKQLRIEIEQLENQIESLQQASQQGIAYAQPTPDEDDQQTKLLIAIGRLQAEREQAQREYDTQQPDTEALDMQQRVLEKIKDVVREEADRLNTALLKDFCELTTEIAQRIGAESINNMKCSALGKVALYKYGDTVSFKSINNEGERLRIKLAFFLALMQVAQTPHGGHHPRLLLIDQPGSAEMVTEDFQQLVAGFRQIDEQLGSNVQIICCTARTEADQATASSKIYDPQAPPYAF
jgi:hypothetical protein